AERVAVDERDAKEAARQQAERARARAREALDAMTAQATGEALQQQPALTEEQKRFLSGGLGYYREVAGAEGGAGDPGHRVGGGAYRGGFIGARRGRRPEGVAAFGQAVAGYEQLAADFPANPEYRRQLATGHSMSGLLLRGLGRRAEAEAAHR